MASAPPLASQPAAARPAISVRNLRMGYGTKVLLNDASFEVRRGEILVILGGAPCFSRR